MTKDIRATRKQLGSKRVMQVALRVPDKVHEIFESYNLEIIDYPNKQTSIFLCKDGEDIDSINFKGDNNFSWAIKQLYERVINEQ